MCCSTRTQAPPEQLADQIDIDVGPFRLRMAESPTSVQDQYAIEQAAACGLVKLLEQVASDPEREGLYDLIIRKAWGSGRADASSKAKKAAKGRGPA